MNQLVNILIAVKKNKWWVIIPVALSIAISFILTLPSIKPPLYEVSLQFFPTRLPQAFRIAENLYAFNFITSDEVKFAVLDKYDKKANPNTKLSSGNYDSRISIKEDQNIATISVFYEDPKTAREIAQYIIDLYSDRSKQLKQQYHEEHADFYLGMINKMNSEIDSIKNEISILAKDSNIFVQTMQTQELTRALLGTYGNASQIDKKELEKTKDMLSNSGGDMIALEKILAEYVKILGAYQNEYNTSINELSKMNLYANVFSITDTGIPSSKRTLTIIISAIATFIVSLTLIILIDTYKPLLKEIKAKISTKQ